MYASVPLPGNRCSLRKRYDALTTAAAQQREWLEEAGRRWGEVAGLTGALLPRLSALEARCEEVMGGRGSLPERVEAVQVRGVEVSCVTSVRCTLLNYVFLKITYTQHVHVYIHKV